MNLICVSRQSPLFLADMLESFMRYADVSTHLFVRLQEPDEDSLKLSTAQSPRIHFTSSHAEGFDEYDELVGLTNDEYLMHIHDDIVFLRRGFEQLFTAMLKQAPHAYVGMMGSGEELFTLGHPPRVWNLNNATVVHSVVSPSFGAFTRTHWQIAGFGRGANSPYEPPCVRLLANISGNITGVSPFHEHHNTPAWHQRYATVPQNIKHLKELHKAGWLNATQLSELITEYGATWTT